MHSGKRPRCTSSVNDTRVGRWYDLNSRAGKLTINPEEADRIREMFRLYLGETPISEIVQKFDKLGWRKKQWTTQDGKLYGGSPLRRCHIYELLGNILYTGQLHTGQVRGKHAR